MTIPNKKHILENLPNSKLCHHGRPHCKIKSKSDRYLDLARELKKIWIMKVTVIPIVIGELGTIPKGLVKGRKDLEIRGQVETIQMTVLLRLARILRWVLEIWGDLLPLKLQWKPSAKGVKNSQRSKIIIMIIIFIIIISAFSCSWTIPIQILQACIYPNHPIMSKICHKVNFKQSTAGLKIKRFSSPRLVAIPRLTSPVCSFIYSYLKEGKRWIHVFPNGVSTKMKCK